LSSFPKLSCYACPLKHCGIPVCDIARADYLEHDSVLSIADEEMTVRGRTGKWFLVEGPYPGTLKWPMPDSRYER